MAAETITGPAYEFLSVSAVEINATTEYIEGFVVNLSTDTWENGHCVGLRHFVTRDGRIIPGFELRAKMGRSVVAPGSEVHFSFDFGEVAIPAGAVGCDMGVVNEGICWLGDRGQAEVRITIAETRTASSASEWLALLHDYKAKAGARDPHRVDILAKVIRRYDFAHYDTIGTIRTLLRQRDMGAPYRPFAASSASVLKALSPAGDPGGAFLRQFAQARGIALDAAAAPEDAARLFNQFTRESGSFFRGGCAPLPAALCQWLGKRALPRAIASTPATRSMIATLGSDRAIAINPGDGGDDLFWSFLTEILIDRNVTQAAVPDIVKARFARAAHHPDKIADFPPLTAFMERLHREDGNYRDRYDIASGWGRCAFAFDLLMLSIESETRRLFLGTAILDWFTTPLGEAADASPLELLLLAAAGRPLDRQGEKGAGVREDVRRLRATMDWLPQPQPADETPAIRVIGEHASPTGLGVNMRMTIGVLKSLALAVDAVDAQAQLTIPGVHQGMALHRPVDIFHLNLDAVPQLVCRFTDTMRPDTYRIAFALWETSVMPGHHHAGAALMDEIWVPSHYVADVYRDAGFTNVHMVGKGIAIDRVDDFDLATLGIAPGDFTFLMSFDMDSWIERKNPAAAIDAFRRAFPDTANVRLIVKTNGLHSHPGDRSGQVDRIEAAAEEDPRIVLLGERLTFAKYLGLIKAADATVSPHRSEGFGYLPAYSLLLDTPVIATDYSGTRDFCTEETSFPAAATLKPIGFGDFVYDAPRALWADINVAELAATMRWVRNDPAEAAARTRRGHDLVASEYSMEAMAQRYADRLAAIDAPVRTG